MREQRQRHFIRAKPLKKKISENVASCLDFTILYHPDFKSILKTYKFFYGSMGKWENLQNIIKIVRFKKKIWALWTFVQKHADARSTWALKNLNFLSGVIRNLKISRALEDICS